MTLPEGKTPHRPRKSRQVTGDVKSEGPSWEELERKGERSGKTRTSHGRPRTMGAIGAQRDLRGERKEGQNDVKFLEGKEGDEGKKLCQKGASNPSSYDAKKRWWRGEDKWKKGRLLRMPGGGKFFT